MILFTYMSPTSTKSNVYNGSDCYDDIESFFKAGDPDFEVDADCEKVVGPFGPRTLKEMREMLGIAEPNFGQVNLNEEENKIQMASV